MRKLFCTNLGIWPTLNKLEEVADQLLHSKNHKADFVNQLVLYDQLVIPTGNLMIVPVLRNWLGEEFFDLLITANVIVLARYDRWTGYCGNGQGLKIYRIGTDDGRINIGTAFYEPAERVLPVLLEKTTPASTPQRREELQSIILPRLTTIDLTALFEKLRHETYTDILKSPVLHPLFGLRHPRGTSLDRLRGIQPNGMKIYSPHTIDYDQNAIEINAVLRIAHENLMLTMGSEVGATDIQADHDTFSVFQAKGQRFGLDEDRLSAFASILNLEKMPNIGEAFVQGIIKMPEVLRIRELSSSQQFRDWFDQKLIDSPNELVAEYVQSLKQTSWINSVPAKILRIGTQTIAGLAANYCGDPLVFPTVLALADSFLLDRWGTRAPHLFIDDTKRIIVDTVWPQPKGTLRNSPCPCGSGKKFKKCHGK